MSRSHQARVNCTPILCPARFCAALLALSAGSGPARADVLEIGVEGAAWISGPQAQQFTSGEADSAAFDTALQLVPEDISVPDEALADPARHAVAVPQPYAAKVQELSTRFDLSPALIEALVWQESRWRTGAVSPKGALGLAQLMPGTARQMGVDPADPLANLEGGARYLREQLDRFDGNLEKALAAYNAGPGRVERANGIPQIRETQTYVAAIMGRLSDHSRSEQ